MERIMETVPTTVLAVIGAAVLAVIAWFLSNFAKTLTSQVQQSLKESRDEMKRESQENKKEQEYDNYLLLRGMQVVTDLEHELVYCVMTGTHNGGLEQANKELDEYRRLSNESLIKKASKWNLKIDN